MGFVNIFDYFRTAFNWFDLNVLSITIAYIQLRWWIIAFLLFAGFFVLVHQVGFPSFRIISRSRDRIERK